MLFTECSIHIHQIKLGFNHSRLIEAMKRRNEGKLRRMELVVEGEDDGCSCAAESKKGEKKMHEKIEVFWEHKDK